jgi:Holliday junction resolvase RusA-like endonuclease
MTMLPQADASTFLQFVVHGPPRTWKRTAHVKRGETIKRVNDREMAAAKEAFALHALSVRRAGWPKDARYALAIRCFMESREHEGDCDNYAKLVGDALERILWSNDRRVDLLIVSKSIGEPRTEIEAAVIEPNDVRLPSLASLARKLCALCGGTGVEPCW